MLEEAEASREQIAELHAYLDEHGIELVGREEAAEAGGPGRRPLQGASST